MFYQQLTTVRLFWGNKNFKLINNIQNRTVTYFMGAHRFTTVLLCLATQGKDSTQIIGVVIYKHYVNHGIK
jgi:hypothetical protein